VTNLQQKFVLVAQNFFSCTPKNLLVTPKKIICTTKKNSICTAKIAIIHTFSGFGTLSELLAHFLGGMLLS